MNWFWIAIALVGPTALGFLVAWPLWRNGQGTFGSTVGASVIFMCAAGLIGREYMELERLTEACIEATGYECLFEPSPFMRFAIYAGIALVEVFFIFDAGIRADQRAYRRQFPSEWK